MGRSQLRLNVQRLLEEEEGSLSLSPASLSSHRISLPLSPPFVSRIPLIAAVIGLLVVAACVAEARLQCQRRRGGAGVKKVRRRDGGGRGRVVKGGEAEGLARTHPGCSKYALRRGLVADRKLRRRSAASA